MKLCVINTRMDHRCMASVKVHLGKELEAGATIKLGKTVLIRKDIFEEYLFSFTVPAME